jgi:lysophospholipase L1-like esterase
MKVTHKVKVDMERREYPVHIDVVQMDANSRVLEISLFSGGVPWNVPTDASVSLAFKKADGHGGWYDTLPNGENAIAVDGNVVNVTLAPEVTTFAGRVDLSLVMQNPETLDQIASFPMVLMVAGNPANGQQLSNDYFNYKTMTEVNKAIDAFANQIGSFDGSLRPIDFTLTATNATKNNWSSIRDLPTNRIYRLPYNDHPVDFGMPYSGSKQSLLAVIGTGNINWYTLYICADRDGAIWMAHDDPASSDDVKWISVGDDPVDVQKHLYDLAKRGQTVARFRGTHIVKKKIKIPASMTVIGGEFIADPSFEDAIFSAGGDWCRLVNVTMKAPALDKVPSIYVKNDVQTTARDSNVMGLYSDGHEGIAMLDCVCDKLIPAKIDNGSGIIHGCRITDCSMFAYATNCRLTVSDNDVSMCDTGLDQFYHVYYLDQDSELVASNNRIRCDTQAAYRDVYHPMTAGNKGKYRATCIIDGDVVTGNFQHIIDCHYADLVLKNCKISNSNTEKWSEFQNWGHIKCRFEGCDLDYTGSVMSDEDLSAYPDAEIVYDCCNITLDDSLNRNRCYWRSNIIQHLDSVPSLRDNSDVISCSFSIFGSDGGNPVGFVDENKYSNSSLSGNASAVGEKGFSAKVIGNVVEFVDSPANEELFVFKNFSGTVANNTFFGTNKGVISESEYDGVFNNYIDGVGVFGNVDEQEVQRIVVEYLKDHPSAGGDVFVDDTLKVSGAAADAKAVGDLFISQKRRFSGFLNTNTQIDIDTNARTLSFGAQSFVSWGAERVDVSNKTFKLADDLIYGGYLFFDPVKVRFVKTYEDGFVFVGALWFPYWRHELNADRARVFINGLPSPFRQKYLGKTVNCLGDSMTDTAITPEPYVKWLAQLLGFNKDHVRNYGLGGSSITPRTETVNDWDTVASFLERYSGMEDADVVIVFGGVNDWVTGRTLGTMEDTDTGTFYGAFKALCQGLMAKYPMKDIYVFGSPQNDYAGRPATDLAGTKWAGNTDGYNRKGHKLVDYVRAMGEVCAVYGIPFCDMTKGLWWGLSGVLGQYRGNADGTHIAGPLGNDGLHPNAEGHKQIALKMAEFIDRGGSDATEPFPDHVPTPTTAQVGQTIVVKEVDESGKPVSWECADLAGGGKLELISETEITTEDEVTLIEFDGLENYDEAMLVVYCPWCSDSSKPAAITQINGTQIEKDWYEFQTTNINKYNVLRIKRIYDKYYDVLAYTNSNSTRYGGVTKIRAIHKGTINKIGFSLSGAMMSQVHNGATTNCVISCYAR